MTNTDSTIHTTPNTMRPDHTDNTVALADALCDAGTGTYPVARALRDAAATYRARHDIEVTTPGSTDHAAATWARMADDAAYAAYRVDASADAWYDAHAARTGPRSTGA